MFKNIRKGFTIVELVIVIAVIAILAGVLIPTFSSVTKNAKKSAAQQQAKNAMEATLALTGGSYPEGTDFVITESTATGKVNADYWFTYEGNKLTDKKTEASLYDTTNNIYAVYFSAKCFDTTDTDKTTDADYQASLALLDKALGDSVSLATGYSLTAASGGGYYELKSTDTSKPTIQIYFTSDIEPALVIIMGNPNA